MTQLAHSSSRTLFLVACNSNDTPHCSDVHMYVIVILTERRASFVLAQGQFNDGHINYTHNYFTLYESVP